jgi:hypothetical protein
MYLPFSSSVSGLGLYSCCYASVDQCAGTLPEQTLYAPGGVYSLFYFATPRNQFPFHEQPEPGTESLFYFIRNIIRFLSKRNWLHDLLDMFFDVKLFYPVSCIKTIHLPAGEYQ